MDGQGSRRDTRARIETTTTTRGGDGEEESASERADGEGSEKGGKSATKSRPAANAPFPLALLLRLTRERGKETERERGEGEGERSVISRAVSAAAGFLSIIIMSREYRGSIIAEADFERREARLNEILVRGQGRGGKGKDAPLLFFTSNLME